MIELTNSGAISSQLVKPEFVTKDSIFKRVAISWFFCCDELFALDDRPEKKPSHARRLQYLADLAWTAAEPLRRLRLIEPWIVLHEIDDLCVLPRLVGVLLPAPAFLGLCLSFRFRWRPRSKRFRIVTGFSEMFEC